MCRVSVARGLAADAFCYRQPLCSCHLLQTRLHLFIGLRKSYAPVICIETLQIQLVVLTELRHGAEMQHVWR